MRTPERIVVDTNVYVSSFLRFDSIPGKALAKAWHESIVLVSEATMVELADVLSRQKWDVYVSLQQRQDFLRELGSVAEWITIVQVVRECRDPRDDKFLEVALNGNADLIVTGDEDLLSMHPWRNISIFSPADYLKSHN